MRPGAAGCAHLFDQSLAGNLAQLGRGVPGPRRQVAVRQQGCQQKAGADSLGLELQRGQDPAFAHQVHELQRQLRQPGIAGLELIERACQLAADSARIDLVMLADSRQVSIGRFEQL